jgi:hypothetical protein
MGTILVCLNRKRAGLYPVLGALPFMGDMVLIASVALSPTPRAIGWSSKLELSIWWCQERWRSLQCLYRAVDEHGMP